MLSINDGLGNSSRSIILLDRKDVYPVQSLLSSKHTFDSLFLVRLYRSLKSSEIEKHSSLSFFGIFLTGKSTKVGNLIEKIQNRYSSHYRAEASSLRIYSKKSTEELCLLDIKDEDLPTGSVLVCSCSDDTIDSDAPFPTFPSWFEYVTNRVEVQICSIDGVSSTSGYLNLSLKMSFDEISQKVASFLNIGKDKFLLIGYDVVRQRPKSRPYLPEHSSGIQLRDMLATMGQVSNRMFYKLKDCKLDRKFNITVLWYNEKFEFESKLEFDLPFESSILDLKKEIIACRPLKDVHDVRLVSIRQCQIQSLYEDDRFPLSKLPTSLNGDPTPLRAELHGMYEKEIQLVRVCRYSKGDVGSKLVFFGEPFLFPASISQTVLEFKQFLKDKGLLNNQELSECKISILKQGKVPRYLKDNQTILHNLDTAAYHPKFQDGDHLGIEYVRKAQTPILPSNSSSGKSVLRESALLMRED